MSTAYGSPRPVAGRPIDAVSDEAFPFPWTN